MNALNADHFGRPREATRIRPNPADLIAPKRATRIRPDHLSKALPDHASEMCSIAGSLWPSRDGSDRAVLDTQARKTIPNLDSTAFHLVPSGSAWGCTVTAT